MMIQLAAYCRRHALGVALSLAAACAGAPLAAQGMQTIDPDTAIDGDLAAAAAAPRSRAAVEPQIDYDSDLAAIGLPPGRSRAAPGAAPRRRAGRAARRSPRRQGDTYKQDDLIGAAEGVFGKGAEGLARMIEDVLKKQGEPNGYIVGREAGGAFVLGARYGSGTLFHKIEGQRPVYWTGPSIGFDAGANAGNTFVLVYNLYDTEELYERYPAGEGAAYFVGGFNASYMRKGDVVLIPIRVGAGLRLGVNAGYMKFSQGAALAAVLTGAASRPRLSGRLAVSRGGKPDKAAVRLEPRRKRATLAPIGRETIVMTMRGLAGKAAAGTMLACALVAQAVAQTAAPFVPVTDAMIQTARSRRTGSPGAARSIRGATARSPRSTAAT